MRRTILVLFLFLTACNSQLAAEITAPPATPTLPPPTPTETAIPTSAPLAITPLSGSGGGVLAFTSARDGSFDIYLMNADGSDPQQLTNQPGEDYWATWSPDGTQIAFASERDGNFEIYVMNADGSNQRQLTNDSGDSLEPDWSPNGNQIAFMYLLAGHTEVYVMDADGGNRQQLTDTAGDNFLPKWSPDSAEIVFVSERDGNPEIYVMNADGSNPQRLTNNLGDDRYPAWSSDGKRISFYSQGKEGRGLYVMDADGSNLVKLTAENASVWVSAWSPDGTKIAFSSDRDGNREIYTLDLTSGELTRLTDNQVLDGIPAWKPQPNLISSEVFEVATAITHGGYFNDRANDVLITEDGGALIAGIANNTMPSHRIAPGNAFLIRTNAMGTVLWEKEYGGDDDAAFNSIIEVGANEFVLLGEIAGSYLRDETDIYLVKVDGEGDEIWSRTFGGRGMDLGKMVYPTKDGGYIIVGDQADELPTGAVYESNIYLIKTDSGGNLEWSRTYGDEIMYLGWGVAQTPDGGYILTGWEAKTYDDRDVILMKTDEAGEVLWSRTWDLGERDGGFDMILTSDGHIVVPCIQSMGSGEPSAVLLKVDLDGNEIWNKLIGEEGIGNTFWHIMEDTDGGYIMVGDTHLGRVPGTGEQIHGAWVVKTDTDGEILWEEIVGEGEFNQAHFRSAALLPGGRYIFVGDATPKGERYSDLWWVQINE